MVLFRRPIAPTLVDLWIVRYGILPLTVLILLIGPWFLEVLDRTLDVLV
jgi:hypothetical protein